MKVKVRMITYLRLFEKTVMIGIVRLFVFFRAFQMGQVNS